jgi:hypothetical protein
MLCHKLLHIKLNLLKVLFLGANDMVSCDSDVLIRGCAPVQQQQSNLAIELQDRLPCVTTWQGGASSAFYDAVRDQYFEARRHGADVNQFHYCILLHKAESLRGALQTFSRDRAFAAHVGRSVLLEMIGEARAHAEWCKPEVLDELARYATYAFVLDGTVMTCGSLMPLQQATKMYGSSSQFALVWSINTLVTLI